LSWFQSTHTANSELCSTLSHANNPAGTFAFVFFWELVAGNPAWTADSVTAADGARRDDASISIRALPCVDCEASHCVGSVAGSLVEVGKEFCGYQPKLCSVHHTTYHGQEKESSSYRLPEELYSIPTPSPIRLLADTIKLNHKHALHNTIRPQAADSC
jgi:hypothetical protein